MGARGLLSTFGASERMRHSVCLLAGTSESSEGLCFRSTSTEEPKQRLVALSPLGIGVTFCFFPNFLNVAKCEYAKGS